MRSNLLETLEILAELVVQPVGDGLRPLAILSILLSVKEPTRDLELLWVLDDGDKSLDLVLGKLARTLRKVNLSHLAAQIRVPTGAHASESCVA